MGTENKNSAILSWLAALICVACLMLILSPAFARWNLQYAAADHATRDWYRAQQLTEAAQKRFNFKSCCDNSDVVSTRFKVGGVGNDEWWWLDPEGKWQRVPDDVIHWGEHAPDGQPTMFAVGRLPTCFYPGDTGG